MICSEYKYLYKLTYFSCQMNKLRLLLTESERSRDDYHEKLEDVTHDRDKLQAEAEQLSQENARFVNIICNMCAMQAMRL